MLVSIQHSGEGGSREERGSTFGGQPANGRRRYPHGGPLPHRGVGGAGGRWLGRRLHDSEARDVIRGGEAGSDY